MLEFIRSHQRIMQLVLLLLIFPSFAFFGLESYTRMGDRENAVAKVGGQSITQPEVDAAQRQQMDRFKQMFGDQVDPKMLDTQEARDGILQNLIAQKALAVEASRAKLAVSDQTLQQTIMGIPGLVGPDGKFDSERYKALLAMQGMTPAMYEARLRQDLALQQLNGSIQSTAFVPKTVATRISDINAQEREVQALEIKAADYAGKVNVTDEMLKSWYDKHATQFEIPEQIKADYVVLSLDALASQISVPDADIKSYYEQNRKRYVNEEQRRASHILIPVAKSASAADKSAARAKAESLLAQLRKNPGDFAKLAKENSQDPGSAEKGGDLGFFGPGMMVKPFEDAAAKLKPGEISGVVESDFGYHIIQLTGVKPAETRPLEEVKGEIAADIKKQLAAKKFTELAETFSNAVYEQADSLKPAADRLKLPITSVAGLTRVPNPALPPTAPFNNPKFLKSLFSDEAIKNKHNTEAVEVAPSTLIAGHVTEYKPVTKKPFEEVKAAVREQVVQEESMRLARKDGEAKLAALKAKPDTAGFGEAKMVSRGKNNGLPKDAFDAVMKAEATKLPQVVGAELPGQGYGIYRVNKVVQPATVDAARRQTEQQQIANLVAQEEMLSYVDVLKQKAKVQIIKKPVAAKAAAQGEGGDEKK
jgi:peptidyl-prolyl cis-trans isomerase D